ncbi:MAG: amidohydrolase family protein [Pseudomonadota bacterium]
MRIIDAHHHIWDPSANPHPWLTGPPIPFRYGAYEALRKPFLWADYDRVAEGWDVAASVTMEGEWDPGDPLGESTWLNGLPRRPQAHAAQAWLDAPDVDAVLAAHGADPLVRSVRHKPRSNFAPGGGAGGMTAPAFIAGFKRLAVHGLMFELQTPWWHLDEAVRLAAHAPDVPIVLNHAGLPSDRSADGLAGWRAAMQRFAAVPRAIVKISGLGLVGGGWDPDTNRIVIRQTIEMFGPERCMFASNYPVDSLCASFDTIWRGFDEATADLGADARAWLFHRTAATVYNIDMEAC